MSRGINPIEGRFRFRPIIAGANLFKHPQCAGTGPTPKTYQFTLSGQQISVTKLRAIVLDAHIVQGEALSPVVAEEFTPSQIENAPSEPPFFSQTISFLRLTIQYEGHIAAVLDVPQNVSASKGDTIDVFFIKKDTEEKEVLGLLKNTHTGHLYDFLGENPNLSYRGFWGYGIFSFFGGFFIHLWKFYPQSFIVLGGFLAYFLSLSFRKIDFRHWGIDKDQLPPESLFWPTTYSLHHYGSYLASIQQKYFSDSRINFLYSAVLILGFILFSIKICRNKQKAVANDFFRHIREAVKIL